jgi:hypothetical protein
LEVAVDVVVVVDEEEVDDEVDDEEEGEELLVVVVVVVVELGDAHDSVIPRTGTLTGSDRAETGVPAGTLTENVSCWPPTTVTVTTH